MEGKTYQSVGQPVRKKDAMALLLGKPAYVDDVTPRDCLVVKVLRSPHAHALIEEIDTTAAMKVPGVAAIFTYRDYGAEDGYNTVRLFGSQLDMKENSAHVNDAGGTDYSWAGTAYYGKPADGGDWGVWRALEVRQMGDGTVYLMDAGNSYDSQGGSFGFGQEIQEKTNVNGVETEQASLSFSVDFEPIPRPNSVTLRQYSGDHVLLAEDILAAEEALALEDGWTVPMAADTAYTLIITDNAGGTQDFALFPEPLDEKLPWTTTLWFLKDSGLGWPVTVELE